MKKLQHAGWGTVIIILFLLVGAGGSREGMSWAQEAAEGTSASPPATAAPEKPAEVRVTNSFFDTDLRQALADLSAQTGIIIIPTEDVRGVVTLDLKNVPFEKALQWMCLPGGYVYKQIEENVWLVGSPMPESSAFRALAETESVELNYLSSKEVRGLLPSLYERYVKSDEIGNVIVVTAPRPILQEVIAIIRQLDRPPRQIMIEALVVETQAGNLTEFSDSLQTKYFSFDSGSGLMTYRDIAQQLLAKMLWLVSKQKATMKANPNIVAQEGRMAKVDVATEQYFTVVTGPVSYPYTTLQQISATVGLEITPFVAEASGEITMRIRPTVADAKGQGSNQLPVIIRRTVEGTLRVKDGEVIAVGGLLQEIENSIVRKIPVLGDIPLVGNLFRSTDRSREQREIVIFIVPHLLDESGTFRGPRIMERLSELLPPKAAPPPAKNANATGARSARAPRRQPPADEGIQRFDFGVLQKRP